MNAIAYQHNNGTLVLSYRSNKDNDYGDGEMRVFSADSNGKRCDPLTSMELGVSLLFEQSSNGGITVALGLPFLTVADMRAHVVGAGSNRVKRTILGLRQDDDTIMNSSLLHLDFTSAVEEGNNRSTVFLQIQRPDLVLDLGFVMDLVEFAAPVLKVLIIILKLLPVVFKRHRNRRLFFLVYLFEKNLNVTNDGFSLSWLYFSRAHHLVG